MAKDDVKNFRNYVDSSISLNKAYLSKVNVKRVIDEGDCLRCPSCGHLVLGKFGVCSDCGERYEK